jgi:hypothetical protein
LFFWLGFIPKYGGIMDNTGVGAQTEISLFAVKL